jgi:aminoglycoside phosphotransferase (APT) family kinase protein
VADEHDLGDVRAGLERWLTAHRPEAGNLRLAPLSRPVSGLSSTTLFAEASWTTAGGQTTRESLVARLPPAGDGLFPTYDLAAQAKVQTVLASTSIPVAAPVAMEEDTSWVGVPFLLMQRVPGRVVDTHPPFLTGGWLHASSTADQATLHGHFIDTLAGIARLRWADLNLGFLTRPEGRGLDGELKWWGSYVEWVALAGGDEDAPAEIAAGLAWCRSHRPAIEPDPSLLWGDVQLVNAVFDASFRPAAILDWEMASIGPAEMDLGWFLAIHAMTVATAKTDLPGFPDRRRTIERYEEGLGRAVRDIEWYETFALVRSGAIMVRVASLLARSGISASWLKGNPTIARLRQVLDTG